jgi:hypothetical protein
MVGSAPHRAFVVKLSAAEDSARVAGRVEHVASGESARFEALEELGAFLARVFAHEQAETVPRAGERRVKSTSTGVRDISSLTGPVETEEEA